MCAMQGIAYNLFEGSINIMYLCCEVDKLKKQKTKQKQGSIKLCLLTSKDPNYYPDHFPYAEDITQQLPNA